jgi:hypothetical protein
MSADLVRDMLAVLRRIDRESGYTSHKPAGQPAFPAAVMPRELKLQVEELVARADAMQAADAEMRQTLQDERLRRAREEAEAEAHAERYGPPRRRRRAAQA